MLNRQLAPAGILLLSLVPGVLVAQARETESLDPTAWGVVYDIPATRAVRLQADVPYLRDSARSLTLDIYTPPGMRAGARLPAVVFLNAVGDGPDSTERVKRWGIYSSWPRLVAAHGMVGISMDADRADVQGSLRAVFRYLAERGAGQGIDGSRIGIYAASANVGGANQLLFSDSAPPGIRAAVLYYGGPPDTSQVLRRDLPVLYVVAQSDAPGMGAPLVALWQRVIDARAPWTLAFGAGMPHAFDAFTDTDDARRLIQQTIGFWQSHLQPVPAPPWRPSDARAILAATYGNEPAPAAELLARWTAAHPADAEAHRQHARTLVALQRYAAADSAYARAYALDSTHPGLLAGLGQMRLGQQRWSEAADYLGRAIAGGVDFSLIHGQLGWALLHLDRNAEAARAYERGFELGIPPGRNTRGVAWYNLACAYARLGDRDRAFAALGGAIDEGMNTRATFESDADLAGLRSDPRFAQLLGRLPAAPPAGATR